MAESSVPGVYTYFVVYKICRMGGHIEGNKYFESLDSDVTREFISSTLHALAGEYQTPFTNILILNIIPIKESVLRSVA